MRVVLVLLFAVCVSSMEINKEVESTEQESETLQNYQPMLKAMADHMKELLDDMENIIKEKAQQPSQEKSMNEFSEKDEADEGIEIVAAVEPFENTNPSKVGDSELYQSDMLLTDEQWDALRMRKAVNDQDKLWTLGDDGNPLVPYVCKDVAIKDAVKAGMDHWMEHTCIKFEETTNKDQPHLHFYMGSGCWSYVGMTSWSGQKVSIGSGCKSLGIVVHEVGHAIGFHHEQSRTDRNNYVIILNENIKSGKHHNFDTEADDNHDVPYDYSSVMHYGAYYFSVNEYPTIMTKNPLAQGIIGSHHKGLSFRDKLLANTMYNCTVKWLEACDISELCLNDGYTGEDCTCKCPPGTSGSKCEVKTDDYYSDWLHPLSEKITTEKRITVETPMIGGTFTKWIVPPACKNVKVTFTHAKLYRECRYQYINVKKRIKDKGQKLCAADVYNALTITSNTGFIITMYNRVIYRFQKTLWEADVTFENNPGSSDC